MGVYYGMKLIIGLGNPDPKYLKTRHNTGYMMLELLGKKQQAIWHKKSKFHGEFAQIELGQTSILLLKPTTYYNDSGLSVRAVKDFYNIDNADILVIHDELKLPFGTIRTRKTGSDAGNNGVKNIISQIGVNFPRIRIGIGHEEQLQSDIDFVLSNFSKAEQAKLPEISQLCQKIIINFANDTFEPTSYNLD
jgi:PTH1 family peptidyl-tRNA hydrolase